LTFFSLSRDLRFNFLSQSGFHQHRTSVHTVFTTTDDVYACNLCEAKFKNLEGLKRHIKRAHIETKQSISHKQVHGLNEPEFICQICNKQLKSVVKMICNFFFELVVRFEFLSQSRLNYHQKSVHTVFTAAKVYACNLCEAKSKSSEGLRLHMKRAHAEVKQSNSHKQVRAKNKPDIVCQICNKQFKSAVKMICIFF
jgi:uncharacterized Zn-finger protein